MATKRFWAAAVAVVALGGPGLAAAPQTPKDVVAEIYRIAAGLKGDFSNCEGKDQTACSIDGKKIRALLTRSLRDAMTAMNKRSARDNEPILDFDPISDSQDPSVLNLTIVAEPETGDIDIVDVTFMSGEANGGVKHDLRYDLKREGGAWRVDDIRGLASDNPWDLRKIIAPPN